MPNQCAFPGCRSWSNDNGLCTSHAKYFKPEDLRGVVKRDAPKSEDKKLDKKLDKKATKKKPISMRSKKMTTVMNEVKKLYPIFLKAHPLCEIKSPDCLQTATVIHHVKGRGKNIANQKSWKACCPPCNSYVEKHHQWAAEKGFKSSRHNIEQ